LKVVFIWFSFYSSLAACGWPAAPAMTIELMCLIGYFDSDVLKIYGSTTHKESVCLCDQRKGKALAIEASRFSQPGKG